MLSVLLNTVASATEVSSDSLTTWVVGAVLLAVQSVFAFILKYVFSSFVKSNEETRTQLIAMREEGKESMRRIDERFSEMMERISEHKETNGRTDERIKALEKQVVRLEQQVRELSEGMVR